jgi:hypothetical protein
MLAGLNDESSRARLVRLAPFGLIALVTGFVLVTPAFAGTESSTDSAQTFPDFGFAPSEDEYSGPLFRLSQDYPQELPGDDELPPFLDIDFSKDEASAIEYLDAVLNYAFEGNEEVDFRVENNDVRDWYHMPWQHYGASGREGIHGLTREAVAVPQQFANTQLADSPPSNVAVGGRFTTWAVGFYNSFGGYTIGQSWANPEDPQAGMVFPEGTVVFKLLFTEAGEDNGVPYLANPQSWDAYVYEHLSADGIGSEPIDAPRVVREVNLIQMDVMIRDDRTLDLSGTGWLFGTYLYNGTLDPDGGFRNLVPLGLQWGNDPDVTDPADNPMNQPIEVDWDTPTETNPLLDETVINSSPDVPYNHLGWGLRLSGPVDYYRSSCQSCHATAEWPVVSPLNPDFTSPSPTGADAPNYQPGGSEWNLWFANLAFGTPFDQNARTTDNILQLQISIKNFYEARAVAEGGIFVIDGYPNGINENELDAEDMHTRDLTGPSTEPTLAD